MYSAVALSLVVGTASAWMGVGGGHGTPSYLGIEQFSSCVGTRSDGSASFHCEPLTKPDACPESSWKELQAEQLAVCMCPSDGFTGVFADMHDGDQKRLTIADGVLTIEPSGNSESWTTSAKICPKFCNATIDFNVPGKPSPPPIKLTASLETLSAPGQATKHAVGFYDPTGTLAKSSTPLNYWIQVE